MKQFLIALDQTVNTVIPDKGLDKWVFGFADEALSARADRLKYLNNWDRFRRAVNFIFFWQKDRCLEARISEILRKHLTVEYR